IKPFGVNGYFQPIAKGALNTVIPEKSSFTLNGRKLVFGKDYLADPVISRIDASMVYAGTGWLTTPVEGKALITLKIPHLPGEELLTQAALRGVSAIIHIVVD